ncbi:hypothetical protein DL98DRAFT_623775 [Cadophora sp. DSE1049]|nr:hypothetical protein DL98DRAFT_623775 [Cadophora sp. DSE1049]
MADCAFGKLEVPPPPSFTHTFGSNSINFKMNNISLQPLFDSNQHSVPVVCLVSRPSIWEYPPGFNLGHFGRHLSLYLEENAPELCLESWGYNLFLWGTSRRCCLHTTNPPPDANFFRPNFKEFNGIIPSSTLSTYPDTGFKSGAPHANSMTEDWNTSLWDLSNSSWDTSTQSFGIKQVESSDSLLPQSAPPKSTQEVQDLNPLVSPLTSCLVHEIDTLMSPQFASSTSAQPVPSPGVCAEGALCSSLPFQSAISIALTPLITPSREGLQKTYHPNTLLFIKKVCQHLL